MCIRTLRRDNKVVGLSINGRSFMLDREICHAIGLEESNSIAELKLVKNEAAKIKNELDSKFFVGKSKNLTIAVRFKESGEIDKDSAQVEFSSDLSSVDDLKKSEYISILDCFVEALNLAKRSHGHEAEQKLKKLIQK
jgi:DNA-binding protein YbaB